MPTYAVIAVYEEKGLGSATPSFDDIVLGMGDFESPADALGDVLDEALIGTGNVDRSLEEKLEYAHDSLWKRGPGHKDLEKVQVLEVEEKLSSNDFDLFEDGS